MCEAAIDKTRRRRSAGAMIDSCNIQKNVNMTIKDGLKKIKMLIAAIDRNQISATEKEDRYQKGFRRR